jgi:hypothetical protein
MRREDTREQYEQRDPGVPHHSQNSPWKELPCGKCSASNVFARKGQTPPDTLNGSKAARMPIWPMFDGVRLKLLLLRYKEVNVWIQRRNSCQLETDAQ